MIINEQSDKNGIENRKLRHLVMDIQTLILRNLSDATSLIKNVTRALDQKLNVVSVHLQEAILK